MPALRRILLVALAAALTLPGAAQAAYTVSYSANSGLSVQGDGASDGASVVFMRVGKRLLRDARGPGRDDSRRDARGRGGLHAAGHRPGALRQPPATA